MFQDFQTPSYAGFWMRFVAYLVDSLLLGAVFVPLGFALGIVMAANADSGDAATTALIQIVNMGVNVVSIVVGWLYQSLLESSSWQGTVGKKLLGLRVTDMNGNRIGFGKATGRYFGKILSGMICFVGFIMVAFTEKKQGLHDMLAGTLVVTGSATGEPYRQPPLPPDFGQRGGSLGLS